MAEPGVIPDRSESALEEAKEQAKRKGLKIGPSKAAPPPKPPPEEFAQRAEAVHQNSEDIKQRTVKAVQTFLEVVQSKELDQNKSVIKKDLEKQALHEVIQLMRINNNLETEEDGIGWTGSIVVLMKIALTQRDRINNLEYRLETLEKKYKNPPEKDNSPVK